jgi:hypothetical protein
MKKRRASRYELVTLKTISAPPTVMRLRSKIRPRRLSVMEATANDPVKAPTPEILIRSP